MIGTGKYDFPGIRKAGAKAMELLLASTGWGASILASPFKPVLDFILGWLSEWLANRGLFILNVGAIYIDGEFSQAKFDKAMEAGLANIPSNLTDTQKKVIDDAVIESFRRFGRIATRN